MELLNSLATSYFKENGGWPNNDILKEDTVSYLYKRISPSILRYTETPRIGGKVNISFGVWIIQPTEGVFLRVELV